ncbi:MAG: hypothetical protein GYA02_07310 [Clostridiaceae bacterium]|jgi:hypothetical protein|nr:hypothetical protein [Clostridiaceae bacterium]
MQTAKFIFILIAILTILPLVAFNLKRLTLKREGEKPRPNIKAIVLVSLSAVVLGMFILRLYTFTINYQPHLVLERFMNSYASLISGKIDQRDFFKEIGSVCSSELNSENVQLLEMIENDYTIIDSMVEGNSVRFQLGEITIPRHYLDKDVFTQIKGVKETDEHPVYMLAMIEVDEARKYYISLLDLDVLGNKWKIISIDEASQETVDYAYRNKLMKAEHANKWFVVK